MEKQLKKTTSKGAGAKCSKATVKRANQRKKSKSDLKTTQSTSEENSTKKKASTKTTKKDKATDKKLNSLALLK